MANRHFRKSNSIIQRNALGAIHKWIRNECSENFPSRAEDYFQNIKYKFIQQLDGTLKRLLF